MLNFGGHTWFKIRPVQTGGINQRRLGKIEIFKRILISKETPNSPGGRKNYWCLVFNMILALFSLFLKLTLDSKREDKESTLAEENIQQIKTLCRLIIFVRNSWMIQKALFQ